MDLVKVGQAIASGVSIVCATCNRYWEGREKQLPEPKCTVTKPCGSPFASMTFPEYDGPMTDFARWCFVCGATATKGVKVRDEPRVIGMCDEHVKMLGRIEPVGLKLNGESVTDIVDRHLGRMSQERFFGPPKKTLIDTMVETEMEWAEEDEKKRRRCG
jgi:hypothetical protein